MTEITRYQLTERQWNQLQATLIKLEQEVFKEEIWSQIENTKQHEKHTIRSLVGQLKENLNKKKTLIEK